MNRTLFALALSWSVQAGAQPAVEAAQQLRARTVDDGRAPRVASAWDDARVGDVATWRFKLSSFTGKLRAEVQSIGPTVTVEYTVTGDSFATPLTFRVGVDRKRTVPHAVEAEPPGSAARLTVDGVARDCEQVTLPDQGRIIFARGAGCRSSVMPYALLDGWLKAGGEDWEVELEAASRGARSAKPIHSDSPVVLAPFAWAYQKESGGADAEVGSYRRYAIRGFVVDAYLRFPMSCNVGFCSYVTATPLGEFVALLIVDVARARSATPRRGFTGVDEVLVINGQKIAVHTERGTTSRGDIPTQVVVSSAVDIWISG